MHGRFIINVGQMDEILSQHRFGIKSDEFSTVMFNF